MISVEEAQRRVIKGALSKPLTPVIVSLEESLGRVLAEPIVSDLDSPPFDNSSMDGFAVQAKSVAGARSDHPVPLEVVATISAGHSVPESLTRSDQCYRIMTGAPVPRDADAVVQVEWTEKDSRHPTRVLIKRPANPGLNIRRRGTDMAKGDTILRSGTRITPAIMGISATLGRTSLAVYPAPRVAIISTGDEIVDPSKRPGPGQIRNSNAYALYAVVAEAGGQPVLMAHAPDHLQTIVERLDQAAQYELILSSGGVSVGDFDLVKTALDQHGTLDFWRVNVKPGKPIAYGHYRHTPFFGLPGNPVSALVTFELFVRPVIRQLQGDSRWQRLMVALPLLQDFTEVSDRRHYVRCRIEYDDSGKAGIVPSPDQGSAIQTSWLNATALMMVPENTGPILAGTEVSVMVLGT